MRFKKVLCLWGPVVFWCAVIFIFSSIPTLPKVKIIWWDFILKKSAHVVEYGILYFLIFRALGCTLRHAELVSASRNKKILKQVQDDAKRDVKCQMPNVKCYLLPFIFGLLYAILDEYHQSFVPGRTARITDVGFDVLGMLVTWWKIKRNLI